MRLKIYNALVNKVPGISYRYHKTHDGTHGVKRILSWIYLVLLNIFYHLLFMRFLGKKPDIDLYETRTIPLKKSESQQDLLSNPSRTVKDYVNRLTPYDVVSFDVFDTLIFRPFEIPTDLFFFMDEALGILDFHRIRMEMEGIARQKHFQKKGNYEISLQQIWQMIEKEVGIDANKGMKLEKKLEMQFCYANPFMLDVYEKLQSQGRRIVITTDMYLPEVFLRELLEHNGYKGFEKIYVSNKYEMSKAKGDLYEILKKDLGSVKSIIHVGDNPHSDIRMAKEHGIDTLLYKNINRNSLVCRAHDMSAMIGSAYRGIINSQIYSGLKTYSMEYEYGFIYGGLFVLGYCSFIHKYCEQNHIDRILFLARDGDILKQVYDVLYPKDDTRYVCWGRYPATKLMADDNRYDYFRRFLWHKSGEKKTVRQLLKEAGLESLEDKITDYCSRLSLNTMITPQNSIIFKKFLQDNWEAVLDCYEEEKKATQCFFYELLKGCKRAAAVDIGWAGSGAVSIAYLCERIWKIPCHITGILAGTNTLHNVEPDASEAMLQNGRLVSYLYSQRENRDLLKKHDLNRDYNIYWELLLSSPQPKFLGYAFDKDGKVIHKFGGHDVGEKSAKRIQRGIKDFVNVYRRHFSAFPEMFQISGRDAYAPMLAAASHNESYLKAIYKKVHLDISVGAD